MKQLTLLSIVLVLTTLIGHEGIRAETVHKWIDGNGQVHFSDRAAPESQSETTEIVSASGKGTPGVSRGLRAAERQLLGQSARREKEVRQARRRSVSKHAAGESRCRAARDRYDRAKRKPGAAKSQRVKNYHEAMRELCR